MQDNQPESLADMKIRAEIKKLSAESNKLMAETRWYPFVVSGTVIAAIIALTKTFL